MATGNSDSTFWVFPELVIDQSDVSGSCKKFSDELLLALEFWELDSKILRFIANLRIKTVALLKALLDLGGRAFLQSVGFDIRHSRYEKDFS